VCGIAGIVRWDNRPVLEHEIRAMCGAMVHRGPDDEGIYLGDGVAIGMRRLSIIDLSNGHQPVRKATSARDPITAWLKRGAFASMTSRSRYGSAERGCFI